jgi:hypothetical protein
MENILKKKIVNLTAVRQVFQIFKTVLQMPLSWEIINH